MVVKCSTCLKLVIYPDSYRLTDALAHVYGCVPQVCSCGKVRVVDHLIVSDGDATLWAPAEEKWVPFPVSNGEIA